MPRKFEMTRDEGEYLVELIEKFGDRVYGRHVAHDLATDIRKLWGMATKEEEQKAFQKSQLGRDVAEALQTMFAVPPSN